MVYGQYQFAEFGYSVTSNTPEVPEEFKPDLIKYLPLFYRKSLLMKSIQDANAIQIAKLRYYLNELEKQFAIETATYGLAFWEHDLGIDPDNSKPDIYRREIIKAKLRGRGTITKELIKNTAESFSNAEVIVIENNSEFSFTIKFIGVRGIPPNMAGLIEEVELIKPAHLLYEFAYTYTWWDSINDLSWNDASAMTWDQLRIYE